MMYKGFVAKPLKDQFTELKNKPHSIDGMSVSYALLFALVEHAGR